MESRRLMCPKNKTDGWRVKGRNESKPAIEVTFTLYWKIKLHPHTRLDYTTLPFPPSFTNPNRVYPDSKRGRGMLVWRKE